MNPNHTPGPFIIDDGLVTPENMIDSIRANPTWVAVGIADEDGYAESVAYCHPMNAPLFAAAPEMLHALKLAAEELNKMGCECDCEASPVHCPVCAVNAAIAKARTVARDWHTQTAHPI